MAEGFEILDALGVKPSDFEAKGPQEIEIEFRLEQANAKHHAIEQAIGQILYDARDAGRLLLEAKSLCPHGTWGPYLAEHFAGSDRTARRYIQIAQGWDRIEGVVSGGLVLTPAEAKTDTDPKRTRVADLSLRGALSLLAEPQEAPQLPPADEVEPVEVEVLEGEATPVEPAPQGKELANPAAHNEHYTPDQILEAVYQCFGGQPDLDPCSNDGPPNVAATSHYTTQQDGLTQTWMGRVFCNPPYNPSGQLQAWTEQLLAEYRAGRVSEAIYLVPAYTDTGWWRLLREFPVCLVKGRLTFKGNTEAARFPSAVFYLGHRASAFGEAFHGLGDFWLCSDLEE